MKTYKFVTSTAVTVNGQPLTMKRRASEPDTSTSPDRLALSILADCVGDDAAKLLSRDFQEDILSHCKAGEEITSDEIEEWKDVQCQLGASIQRSVWTPDGKELPVTGGKAFSLPRLLRVQMAAVA
jgi:hypothetical protein